MVDVDINICRSIIFQILAAGISREAIDNGCLNFSDDVEFLSELRKLVIPKSLEISKMYYDKYGYTSVNENIIAQYLKKHIGKSYLGNPIEGLDLIYLADEIAERYNYLYDYFGFNDKSKEFEIDVWNSDAYEEGYALWEYLEEYGVEAIGEYEEEVYLYRGSLYEININEGFLFDIIKYSKVNESLRPLVLYYLDKLMFLTLNANFIAMSDAADEAIKLLVLKVDHYVDTKKELNKRFLYTAMVPVIKKYIENKIKLELID